MQEQDPHTHTPQQSTSASSPTGYAQAIRSQFLTSPQFKSPSELATRFHEALIGRGEPTTLSSQQQQARYAALADLEEVREFSKAAGAELARVYLILDGLVLRFSAQLARIDLAASQGQAAARELDRVTKLLDLVLRCTRESRFCLSASHTISLDLRAFASVTVEVPVGGSHSDE